MSSCELKARYHRLYNTTDGEGLTSFDNYTGSPRAKCDKVNQYVFEKVLTSLKIDYGFQHVPEVITFDL